MRKAVLALALASTLALLLLAQSISALTTLKAPGNTRDTSDPVVTSDGDQFELCPRCHNPMRYCEPPSDYMWICHNCGYHVMR